MSNGHPPELAAEPASEAPVPVPPAQPAEQPGDPTQTTGLLPPAHWTQLAEQQNLDEDNDSAFGDTASSTDSITSSILEYRTIHGRTYHSDNVPGNAQYWGSNDEMQSEAMDIKDFADEHPGAEVIGTDISPIQPKWVPPNLKFEIEDCTSEWTFNPNTFDYIHMRYLVGSVIDWTALFKEAYAALKPGAWLESFEGSPHMISDDGTVSDKSAISQWGKFFEEGGKTLGRSFMVVDEGVQRKAMEEAGFVDIQEWDCKAPVGSWPRDKKRKNIGQWAQTALECDIEGYVLFIANVIAAASVVASRRAPGLPSPGPSKPDLTYLFTVNITTSSTSIGTTPFGERKFQAITGGSFSGPRLKGNVASGGADWGIVGSNGDFSPDVAYVLETHNGSNILVRQRGRAPNVFSLFETGSDEYGWLNLVVAYGEATSVTGTGVSLDLWQVGTYAGTMPS
ncbi:hypothetical protein VMCG_05035 [Cytospora schulzeri]|uniref:Uncharacterized protein n=1 Tax=Cytospora schulzeri TaxID=448051 RepID=A0A423WMI2_9PEZI|nr:hypothetical protein VMCG_05035 [Valsa malicola]